MCPSPWLFEKSVEFCLNRIFVGCGVVLAVFKREDGAVIGALAFGDVLGDVFAALIMGTRIPEFAVAAAIHVLSAVGAGVGALHFDAIEIDFVTALEAKMMSLFDLGCVHFLFLFVTLTPIRFRSGPMWGKLTPWREYHLVHWNQDQPHD